MTLVLRRPAALFLVIAVSGCAHESDGASHVQPESPDDFARRALLAMDAAVACPALEKAWDEYLEPQTRAAVERLVPCTRRVLAARHEVVEVSPYDDHGLDLPEALAGADVHAVRLVESLRREADSFPLSDFLGDGWLVVSQDGDSWLLNPTILALDECLAAQEECRLAG